jgi:uncharacterized alkaline shock family protein YloU
VRLLSTNDINTREEQNGSISFANDVVATIAGLATIEIEGVAGMSGGFSGGLAELLGRKNLTKGVKVEVGKEECAIDLFVIVDYGSDIPAMSKEIQSNVKKAVETMTGLRAVEINIHIQGVNIKKDTQDDSKRVH